MAASSDSKFHKRIEELKEDKIKEEKRILRDKIGGLNLVCWTKKDIEEWYNDLEVFNEDKINDFIKEAAIYGLTKKVIKEVFKSVKYELINEVKFKETEIPQFITDVINDKYDELIADNYKEVEIDKDSLNDSFKGDYSYESSDSIDEERNTRKGKVEASYRSDLNHSDDKLYDDYLYVSITDKISPEKLFRKIHQKPKEDSEHSSETIGPDEIDNELQLLLVPSSNEFFEIYKKLNLKQKWEDNYPNQKKNYYKNKKIAMDRYFIENDEGLKYIGGFKYREGKTNILIIKALIEIEFEENFKKLIEKYKKDKKKLQDLESDLLNLRTELNRKTGSTAFDNIYCKCIGDKLDKIKKDKEYRKSITKILPYGKRRAKKGKLKKPAPKLSKKKPRDKGNKKQALNKAQKKKAPPPKRRLR